MRQSLTPDDLLTNPEFELFEEIDYANLKSFVVKEIERRSVLIVAYSIVQVVAILAVAGLLAFFTIGLIVDGKFSSELITAGCAILFSCTLLIPIHELIHAAAFLILGKRDIGFGVQWKKFLFYAEANMQVLNRKEMTIVGLTPLVVIAIVSTTIIALQISTLTSLFFALIFTVHLLFCGGDIAIISFFVRHKQHELYTFDNCEKKKSFYFVRKKPE
jgi:hypothetical protein